MNTVKNNNNAADNTAKTSSQWLVEARDVVGETATWEERVIALQALFRRAQEAQAGEVVLDYVVQHMPEGAFSFRHCSEYTKPEVMRLYRMGFPLGDIRTSAARQIRGNEPHRVMARWGAAHGWSLGAPKLHEVFSACGEEGLRVLQTGTAKEISAVLTEAWRTLPRERRGPFAGILEVSPLAEDFHQGDLWTLWHVTCTGNTAVWQCTRGRRTVWRVLRSGQPLSDDEWAGCFYGLDGDYPSLPEYLMAQEDPQWGEGEDIVLEIEDDQVVSATYRGWARLAPNGYNVAGHYHVAPLIPEGQEVPNEMFHHLGHLRHAVTEVDEAEVEYWEHRLGV